MMFRTFSFDADTAPGARDRISAWPRRTREPFADATAYVISLYLPHTTPEILLFTAAVIPRQHWPASARARRASIAVISISRLSDTR